MMPNRIEFNLFKKIIYLLKKIHKYLNESQKQTLYPLSDEMYQNLRAMVLAALGGYGCKVSDNMSKIQKNTIYYKIGLWFSEGNFSVITPHEFYIINECVKATFKYLDDDEFHTWFGVEEKEIYAVKDFIEKIEKEYKFES